MTRDVSAEYDRWVGGGQAAPFAPDSPYGGDAEAVRSGRIDPGRAELDRAVQRQLAQTGSDDYDAGLTIVLSQCRSGVLTLSQPALQGTGLLGVRAGRNGLQHHPVTGEVIALAAAPTPPLGAPPVAPEATDLFKDTLAYCQSRRPAASEAAHGKSVETVMARSGPTAGPQVTRWPAQGGAEAAFR
jgi:hypothetical protein